MNVLFRILVLLKLRKVKDHHIEDWVNTKNINLIFFSIEHGSFKEKIEAVKGLKRVGDKSVIDKLLYISRTEVGELSDVALDTVKYLDRNNMYKLKVERIERNNETFLSLKLNLDTTPINRKERMKMLEHVRGLLRKPIR